MKFSVVTPTYNRARLIERVYSSLQAQSFREFEWIIIDDGSNDGTDKVVSDFKAEADFPIRYYWKENGGKVSALNEALDYALGEWFLVFDSDDWCTPDALERLSGIIDNTSEMAVIPEVAAISVLKVDKEGRVIGEEYKNYQSQLKTYVDRFNLSIKGDKWEIIRTDIHREHRYDIYAGEKYMAPEYVWLKIGRKYRTLFFDEKLSIIEYQDDGISSNNIFHRVTSPNNAVRFYKLGCEVARSKTKKMKMLVNYSRFRLHRRESFIDILSFLFIPALLLYIKDLYDIRRRARGRC